jgi:NADH-quinone oxidoreductase subunit N
MVFGIAFIFGSANTTNLYEIAAKQGELAKSPVFLVGLLLTVVGLGFKIAAFPFQMWAPDVYPGAPTTTTAFLATGSKAAGFALLLRIAFGAVPEITAHWSRLLLGLGIVTILYGSLCAIPQRSVKRLMGYSSIANAGYLLLGVGSAGLLGGSAVLAYLGGYIFTVLTAFAVITVVAARTDSDDISSFAALGQRSPLLATGLTVAMAGLAGIPPMAGFFGKYQVFQAGLQANMLWLVLVGAVSSVISLGYYLRIVWAIMVKPQGEALDRTEWPVAMTVLLTGLAVFPVLTIGIQRLLDAAINASGG